MISATNRDLGKMVQEGEFREDLYYRICTIPIEIPPLKERREDIELLTDFYFNKLKKELNKQNAELEEEVVKLFKYYNWPGNVRELQKTLKNLILLTDSNRITVNDLPPPIRNKDSQSIVDSYFYLPHEEAMEAFEKKYLLQLLEKFDYKVADAAKHCKRDRSYIYDKIKKYGLKR